MLLEAECDPHISKDHAYAMAREAAEAAEEIRKKHALPEGMVLKITSRPQKSGAHIDYSNWKIVIDYNSLNIQKALIDRKALRGLLAHEMMHMSHKLNGTEDKIIGLFAREFKKRGLGRDMMDLMFSLGMVAKDVAANDDLIESGFADELFKHYMIVVHSRVRDNELLFNELSGPRLKSFFIALIGLMPAYVPFYRKGMPEKGGMVKRIIDRHFQDLPEEIRAHMPEIEASLRGASLTEDGVEQFVESVLRCHSLLLGN